MATKQEVARKAAPLLAALLTEYRDHLAREAAESKRDAA